MTERPSALKLIQLGLWGAVVIVAIVGGALYMFKGMNPTQRVAELPGAITIGGPFKLTSHKGAAFDSESLKGKPYLVFFGFTHCPDICPTTLLDVTNQMKDLGDDGRELRALFVTVDPARDTPEHLAKYLESFDPRIIGLTGTDPEIKHVAGLYRAMYEKAPTDNDAAPDEYSMNHTATVYLVDRKGRFAGTLDFQEKPDVRVRKLKRLLDG